ncbi:MAG: hypothetical protein Q4G24_10140 [Paracoccus sp. (in: a-proteobacteria)]|uniref:hypothetical protein n=1 Tax=Paracoccus sp. TaxID=267 RepID=UPI0026E0B0AE|nr:hypothetical protein [Paracoccus sp. (in: a-proteobacteria)]MDO5621818.1 hypothetical protein [Paracoccus sp. (in: a-proteobacteria)]
MIGVVVWSCDRRHKAVIWCEDQGALAYLRGQDGLLDHACWPQPGDMLELDTHFQDGLRIAHQVRMYRESSCPDLPQFLRRHAPQEGGGHLRVVSSRTEIADNEWQEPIHRRAVAASA